MKLTDKQKKAITKEYSEWQDRQYAGKSLEERQELGQFYTPAELTIQMIEKLDNLEGNVLDPTCGCGGLLAGCILTGADPKRCYGIELDPKILEVCRERLGVLGVPVCNLHLGNALNEDCYDNFNEGYSYDIDKNVVTVNGKKPKKQFVFGK